MANEKMPQNAPAANPAPTGAKRPQAPPYRPDKELIGYIEKGQKPQSPHSSTTREALAFTESLLHLFRLRRVRLYRSNTFQPAFSRAQFPGTGLEQWTLCGNP